MLGAQEVRRKGQFLQVPVLLEEVGGIIPPPHKETVSEVSHDLRRLHVRDIITNVNFLIDTGSDLSLIPIGDKTNKTPSGISLFAANESRIDTFGERYLTLNLGLRRSINWNFCVADVPCAIIGADLLRHYGLMVDLSRDRLIDSSTNIFVVGKAKSVPPFTLSAIALSNPYAEILSGVFRTTVA